MKQEAHHLQGWEHVTEPLMRCLIACRLLSLLPSGPDRATVVASTLADLGTMEPEAQPFAAAALVTALTDDERVHLHAVCAAASDTDRAGVGKVGMLAALIPHTHGQERQQLRAQARRITRSLSATTLGTSGKSLHAEALEQLEYARTLATNLRK